MGAEQMGAGDTGAGRMCTGHINVDAKYISSEQIRAEHTSTEPIGHCEYHAH